MKISGGNLSTPFLVAVSPGIVADESKTPRFVNQIICTSADLMQMRVGSLPIVGMGDHVIDISDATPIGGEFFQVSVTAITTPRDYTMRELAPVTVLPRTFWINNYKSAIHLRSALRPRSILLNCERAVSFVEGASAATVNIPDPVVPTFAGVPVDFYGTVYDDEGKSIGTTQPLIAPSTITVDIRLEPWLGTFYKLTTITADRPLFI